MRSDRKHVLIVRRIPAGWALDSCRTPDGPRVFRLFRTTALPMPLTSACSAEDALEFARSTPAGLEWGVFPEVL